jgi:hypothetical protein
MIRPFSNIFLLIILSTPYGFALADGTAYDAYKAQLNQQQKNTKPLTNTQFVVTNAMSRANKESREGASGGKHRIVQGKSDGSANVNSVNIGSNAKMNNATIIIKADHSNSTIVNKDAAMK